jgi:quinol monooxygenase YgiN
MVPCQEAECGLHRYRRAAMGFVQIIEYRTSRRDEVDALFRQWDETSDGSSTVVRAIDCADRDQPDTYVSIIEFPSYEAAMENSGRPETTAFAEQMAKLCDGPATFRNLDILEQRQG